MKEVLTLHRDDIFSSFKGFTVVGDIHGDYLKFKKLTDICKEKKHFLISVGDIVDYGDDSVSCVKLMSSLYETNKGLMIFGNHERKYLKFLKQYEENNIKIKTAGGIAKTIEQFNTLSDEDKKSIIHISYKMIEAAPYIVKIDHIVIAHGGIHKNFWDTEESCFGEIRNTAIFGEVIAHAEVEDGKYPSRNYDWVNFIPKDRLVIIGHDIVSIEPLFKENENGGKLLHLDTGNSKMVNKKDIPEQPGKLSYADFKLIDDKIMFVKTGQL